MADETVFKAPPGLEQLQPYLSRARELRGHSPAASLACLSWAARAHRELGAPGGCEEWRRALDERVAAAEAALGGVDLKAACTAFAESLAANAGRTDFSGCRDLNVAEAFHVAGLVFEVSAQYGGGGRDDALADREMFARCRAQDIRRCAAMAPPSGLADAVPAARPPAPPVEFVPAAAELAVGQSTTYSSSSNGRFAPARVVGVHHDAEEVYYTICVDGCEKGTVAKRLGSLVPTAGAARSAAPDAPGEPPAHGRSAGAQPAHRPLASSCAQGALESPTLAPTAWPQPAALGALDGAAAATVADGPPGAGSGAAAAAPSGSDEHERARPEAFGPAADAAPMPDGAAARSGGPLSAAAVRARARALQARGGASEAPHAPPGGLGPPPQPPAPPRALGAPLPEPSAPPRSAPPPPAFRSAAGPAASLAARPPAVERGAAQPTAPPSAARRPGQTVYAVFDAQSEAKLAVSAIDMCDRGRAIAHLRKALTLLAA